MKEVLDSQPQMSFLRCFLEKVWANFEGPLTESEAEEKLAGLVRYTDQKSDHGYTKSVEFLKEHFTCAYLGYRKTLKQRLVCAFSVAGSGITMISV
jgi:hypothetical protein